MSFSLKDLDPNDFASWPQKAKYGVVILACLLLLVAGYWFVLKGRWEDLQFAEKKEDQLKQTYLSKKGLAVNLPAYREQMKQMEESFGVLLRQLPNKTEIPELLVDISQSGLGRGLQFELFQPQSPVSHDFYSEIPISIRVVGDYHSMGKFVSDLAGLPRVVTLGNIVIKPRKSQVGGEELVMAATVKTYHYLDEEEQAKLRAEEDPKDGKKRGKRK